MSDFDIRAAELAFLRLPELRRAAEGAVARAKFSNPKRIRVAEVGIQISDDGTLSFFVELWKGYAEPDEVAKVRAELAGRLDGVMVDVRADP